MLLILLSRGDVTVIDGGFGGGGTQRLKEWNRED
jgi:hypothetical protein